MTVTSPAAAVPTSVQQSVNRLVAFLQTGATEGLFAPDVFADITLPHWRVQAVGPEERARVTVRKAIASALDAIHAADPVVARHLTTQVHTGVRCCYEADPDAPIIWHL